MKILKLHFKNIHSLKDEHFIDFNTEPLSSAGLFLISGPTGSGKSTILDVITLALYNEVPRFGTISKNDIVQYGSIITHHTRDAFAEIHYQCKGVTYASKWSLAKNRNDNFNDYHMELWNISEHRLLDYKRSEVKDGNAKIIGLNYEQFVKSILLSQGEFAQFLKAPHAERAELLEKITGTEIYRILGKAAFEKHKSIKELVEKGTALFEHLTLLDDEEVLELENRIATIEKEITLWNESLLSLQKNKYNKEQYDLLSKEQSELVIQKEKLDLRQTAFESKKAKMTNYEKIIPLRGDISIYHELNRRTNAIETQYINAKSRLSESLKSKSYCVGQIKLLLHDNVDEKLLVEKLLVFESEVKSKYEALSQLQKQGALLRAEISESIKLLNHHDTSWYNEKVKPEVAIEQLNNIKQQAHRLLILHDIDPSTSMTTLMKSNETVLQKINTYKLAQEALKQAASMDKEIEKIQSQVLMWENHINVLLPEIESIKSAQMILENELNDLRIQKETTFARQELSAMRDQLVDGKPCPLCGALDHPYCVEKHVVEIGTIEITIRAKEQLFKKESQALLEKNTLLGSLNSNTQSGKNNLLNLQTDYSNLKKQLNLLGCDHFSLEEIALSINQLIEKTNINRQIIASLELNKLIVPIIDKYVLLDQTLSTYLEQSNTLSKYGKVDQIMKNATDLREQYQFNTDQCMKIEAEITSLEKQKYDDASKLELVGQSLHISLLQLGLGDLQEMNQWLISEDEYNALRSENEAILLEKEKWFTKNEQITKQIQELPALEYTLIDAYALKQEIEALSSKKDNTFEEKGKIVLQLKQNDDNKIKIKEASELIATQKSELVKWEMLKQFIGDAQGKMFANYAQELTLNHIIILANIRLRELTDRYIITHKNNDLFVTDQYLGNIERSVKTLSGGESFILSLALALSLSDLASRQVRLDCLFIDEGFGTLDEETLDTVIGTLEKLQQESEKTIGIISHVESLKERILCQIQLKKNLQGLSSMKIN